MPAELVEQAQQDGQQLYVSPNGDGSGVIVTGGTFPEAATHDAEAVNGTPGNAADVFDQGEQLHSLRQAFDDAGLRVVLVTVAGTASDSGFTQSGYTAFANKLVDGFPSQKPVAASPAAVIATLQPVLDANPGVVVIDLTD